MAESYEIVFVERPEETAWGVIGHGIHFYNEVIAGDNHYARICFALLDAGQQIVGGILGASYWKWLYIDLLWIPEELRGSGYGHRLLTMIEEEGRKRGLKHVYLDTFSFQAPEFYKQHGYRIFGELEDFPPGHKRFWFTKDLE